MKKFEPQAPDREAKLIPNPQETPILQDAKPIENMEQRLPDYTVEIYFGVHGTAEDVKGAEEDTPKASLDKFRRRGLAESFKKADVYVPELHGWAESSLIQLQELSYGRITPDQLLAETRSEMISNMKVLKGKTILKPEEIPRLEDDPMFGFKKSQIDMIYKSYKPIVIFDVPQEDPRSEVLHNHVLGKSKEQPSRQATFEKTLATIKVNLRTTADLHNEREDYMLSQLTPKLEEVFKQRPDLKNKPNLRVLMFLGAVHTRMAQMMSKYGIQVESRHSRSPHIFGFSNEAHRRLALGKEVSNELAAKVLLEKLCLELMGPVVTNLTDDNNEVGAFIRKIVNVFTYEEIKYLYGLEMSSAILEFFSYLGKKKINPPRDHTELISFLSNK